MSAGPVLRGDPTEVHAPKCRKDSGGLDALNEMSRMGSAEAGFAGAQTELDGASGDRSRSLVWLDLAPTDKSSSGG